MRSNQREIMSDIPGGGERLDNAGNSQPERSRLGAEAFAPSTDNTKITDSKSGSSGDASARVGDGSDALKAGEQQATALVDTTADGISNKINDLSTPEGVREVSAAIANYISQMPAAEAIKASMLGKPPDKSGLAAAKMWSETKIA